MNELLSESVNTCTRACVCVLADGSILQTKLIHMRSLDEII